MVGSRIRNHTIHEPTPIRWDIRLSNKEVQIGKHLHNFQENPVFVDAINLKQINIHGWETRQENRQAIKPNPENTSIQPNPIIRNLWLQNRKAKGLRCVPG